MKKLLLASLLCILLPLAMDAASLKDKIAKDHSIISEDTWHGFHRIKFDFEGLTAWVVEPSVKTAAGSPWTWTMQWAEAYVNRTGVPDLLAEGYHHVTIEAFDLRATDEGLKVMNDFQSWLVRKLGFAAKADLVGMSWGGFFSIRYASAYPDCVEKIYLDAPLLNLDGYDGEIGPWQDAKGETVWTDDPRMPVNMAGNIAEAHIPVLLLYGGMDTAVKPLLNCELFASRFKALGGNITVNKRWLYGHHPHGMDPGDTHVIAEFFSGK